MPFASCCRCRYAPSYIDVGHTVASNAALTHADPVILGQTKSFATIISALINGEKLDENLGYRCAVVQQNWCLHVASAAIQPQPGRPGSTICRTSLQGGLPSDSPAHLQQSTVDCTCMCYSDTREVVIVTADAA